MTSKDVPNRNFTQDRTTNPGVNQGPNQDRDTPDRNPGVNQGTNQGVNQDKEESIRSALAGKGVDLKFANNNWTITKNGSTKSGSTSVPVAEVVSAADAL